MGRRSAPCDLTYRPHSRHPQRPSTSAPSGSALRPPLCSLLSSDLSAVCCPLSALRFLLSAFCFLYFPMHGTLEIRVRYAECDPMGVAHHTAYPVWFEMGRTELLRSTGRNYRDLENDGYLLAVVKLSVQYKCPLTMTMCCDLRRRLIQSAVCASIIAIVCCAMASFSPRRKPRWRASIGRERPKALPDVLIDAPE